ncbi:GtrA family protein [Vulcanococcus limneticus]|uniref:GtrA family protein n=1 Tax=Vulcanococcus limneticus TaxID=2170428 RepID=UPI00398BEB2F
MIGRLRRLAGGSLPRFLLVGALGELLYLALYALGWRLTGQATLAIALAGGVCLLVNAVLHARVSFRVPFRRGLMVRYAAIQGFCLALSLGLGALLQAGGAGPVAVGLISLVVWSGCSFLLTRAAFRPAP